MWNSARPARAASPASAEDPSRRADHLLGDLEHPQLVAHPVLDGARRAARSGRARAAGSQRRRRLDRRRFRGHVAEQARQLHRGDAVDHAVMCLADHADAPVGELVRDPHLPQRPVALERRRVHVLDEPPDLPGGRMPHVMADVECRIVDPLGIVQRRTAPRRASGGSAARRARGPRSGGAARRSRGGGRSCRRPEERHPPHVHVGGRGLHLEERRIERRESHAAAVRSRRWHLSTPSGFEKTCRVTWSHQRPRDAPSRGALPRKLRTKLAIRPRRVLRGRRRFRPSERRTEYAARASGLSASSRSGGGQRVELCQRAGSRSRPAISLPTARPRASRARAAAVPGSCSAAERDHVAAHLAVLVAAEDLLRSGEGGLAGRGLDRAAPASVLGLVGHQLVHATDGRGVAARAEIGADAPAVDGRALPPPGARSAPRRGRRSR